MVENHNCNILVDDHWVIHDVDDDDDDDVNDDPNQDYYFVEIGYSCLSSQLNIQHRVMHQQEQMQKVNRFFLHFHLMIHLHSLLCLQY
jgi:hypothetical protein